MGEQHELQPAVLLQPPPTTYQHNRPHNQPPPPPPQQQQQQGGGSGGKGRPSGHQPPQRRRLNNRWVHPVWRGGWHSCCSAAHQHPVLMLGLTLEGWWVVTHKILKVCIF